MTRLTTVILSLTAVGITLASAAADAPLSFLERRNMTTPQDKPFPMPQSSAAERERNKQLLLDFYKMFASQQFTEANRKKFLADDFIQHDPAEPNTSEAYFYFFSSQAAPPMLPPAT